jgi:ribosomal protein S18 acetylase RimI-like enzyme
MIRRGGPDDVGAIAELYERSFATLAFLPVLHTLDEHRRWFTRVASEKEVWVYEEEDEIVGFAVLGADTLDYLYLEPRAFGRGIGSALLAKAKERRPDGFRFWVFQQNQRARRFYESRGCRLVELTDGSHNEEKTPDALYEWLP